MAVTSEHPDVLRSGTYLAPSYGVVRHPGLEERMAEAKETRSGTYRCPVCGHRDTADLEVDQDSVVIPCSYCNTPLEISSRGADSIRFSVKVSEQPAGR